MQLFSATNLFKARLSIYSTFTHLMMGFASPCFPDPGSLIPGLCFLLHQGPSGKSEQMSVKRFKDVHVKCFILW